MRSTASRGADSPSTKPGGSDAPRPSMSSSRASERHQRLALVAVERDVTLVKPYAAARKARTSRRVRARELRVLVHAALEVVQNQRKSAVILHDLSVLAQQAL